MSSQQDDVPAVSFQKSIISGNLNSSLMVQFLSGAYFGFYIVTLWIYSTMNQSRQRVVTSVLTVLFATTFGQLIMAWYYTYKCFSGTAQNRLEMYNLILGGSGSNIVSLVNVIMWGTGQILADALLIWRCWQILAQRRYIRLVLLFLYICEVALIIISDTIGGLQFLVLSDRTVQFTREANFFQASSLCVTAATSMMATIVISLHIHFSSRMNRRARKRYAYIIEITIQSSALYSLALLVEAITGFIFNDDIDFQSSTVLNAALYTDVIAWIMTSFAPTLMVARLALAKDTANEDLTTDMSAPQDYVLSAYPESTPSQMHPRPPGSSIPHVVDDSEVQTSIDV